MEIKGRFDHFNINVTDLDRSLAFYREALGLHEIKRKEAADGSFAGYNTAVAYPIGIVVAILFLGIFLYTIKKRNPQPHYETLHK